MNEASLSKYQRKKLAKQRGNWTPPPEQVPTANAPQPNAPIAKPPKPKQPPPPQRGLLNNLGTMPDELAALMAAATANLRAAAELADKILAASSVGLQTAEPRALAQMIASMADRADGVERRARCIPNKRLHSPTGGRAVSAETPQATPCNLRPEASE